MARRYDIADLITLPRLDASGADALVTELDADARRLLEVKLHAGGAVSGDRNDRRGHA